MITRRIFRALIALLVVASVPTLLFAQAAAKVPPFRVKADKMSLDLGATPQQLVYDNNVKFTSSLHDTTITCGHLEANAKSLDKVKSVQATEKVVMVMTIETKDAKAPNGKSKSRVDGTGESVTYSMDDQTVRMIKVGNVLPKLTITDLTTKEVTDITGDEIIYDMANNKLTVHQVDMGNEGNGQ